MDILEKIKSAQNKLRATQINWQEECLFDCDDILTEIIHELEKSKFKSAAVYHVLEVDSPGDPPLG